MTDSISFRKMGPSPEFGDPAAIKMETSERRPRVEMAALVGGSAGAVIGLFGGALGVAVGAVVGAFAGGLTGQVMGDFGDPTRGRNGIRDTYTTRSHYCSPRSHDDISADTLSVATTPQATREAWSHLDETSKDSIRGSLLPESDDS